MHVWIPGTGMKPTRRPQRPSVGDILHRRASLEPGFCVIDISDPGGRPISWIVDHEPRISGGQPGKCGTSRGSGLLSHRRSSRLLGQSRESRVHVLQRRSLLAFLPAGVRQTAGDRQPGPGASDVVSKVDNPSPLYCHSLPKNKFQRVSVTNIDRYPECGRDRLAGGGQSIDHPWRSRWRLPDHG